MKRWVYDDLSWWIDAIHRACCPIVPIRLLRDARREAVKTKVNQPIALTKAYQAILSLLREGSLSTELARVFLFGAKALKKWKLADSRSASDRATKAYEGFEQRNEAAAHAPLVPWPYCEIMAEVLREWLPEPESTTHGSRDGYGWSDVNEQTLARQLADKGHDVHTGTGPGARLKSEYTACTGRFGPGEVAEKWSHARRLAKLVDWCDSPHWPEAPLGVRDARACCARLSAVPKDYEKDRLITVEPAYNSFVQQQVRQIAQLAIHHSPLRGTCMDLGFTDGAAIQRRLALKASKTGKLATLDLSDASDNITWRQVQQVFPAWFTHLLGVTRSTQYVSPLNPTLKRDLYIFAGMGNATTFTVETLFFAAFVKAYARAWGLPQAVSVFGDDIICDSETASRLVKEGFTFFRVNAAKSFLGTDALRESCGVFAYRGEDITVPKVDGYPDNWVGRLGIASLHQRLASSGFGWQRRLAYLIARTRLLPNWPFVIDGYPSVDDDLVERSPLPPARWNKKFQSMEYHLTFRQVRQRRFHTDDRIAARFNEPPVVTWYYARLCGMLGSSGARIRSPRDVGHGSYTVGLPEKDRFEWVDRWVGANPSPTCLLPAPAGHLDQQASVS